MRILIFVFVFLTHLQLVSSLTPQKAFEGFMTDFWKYMSFQDTDINHPDYKYIDVNGIDTTEKKMKFWQSNSSVQWFIRKYEEALGNKNNFWENWWDNHIVRFTEDGLLEEKEFKNNQLHYKRLMIPDSSMQGGYKLFKEFEYKIH